MELQVLPSTLYLHGIRSHDGPNTHRQVRTSIGVLFTLSAALAWAKFSNESSERLGKYNKYLFSFNLALSMLFGRADIGFNYLYIVALQAISFL